MLHDSIITYVDTSLVQAALDYETCLPSGDFPADILSSYLYDQYCSSWSELIYFFIVENLLPNFSVFFSFLY